SGPQLLGHVLQVHPDAVPGGIAPAHLVDEHVSRLEALRGLGMAFLPALEPGERILLLLRPADLDHGQLAALGRLHARRLAGLLPIVWRPGRAALPPPVEELDPRLERPPA